MPNHSPKYGKVCFAHSIANLPHSSLPGVVQILIGTPFLSTSPIYSRCATTNAKRYVDITGVFSNVTRLSFPLAMKDEAGILDNAVIPTGTLSVTEKVAFLAGSSQQGKHRLASVASNCVAAPQCFCPFNSYEVR